MLTIAWLILGAMECQMSANATVDDWRACVRQLMPDLHGHTQKALADFSFAMALASDCRAGPPGPGCTDPGPTRQLPAMPGTPVGQRTLAATPGPAGAGPRADRLLAGSQIALAARRDSQG